MPLFRAAVTALVSLALAGCAAPPPPPPPDLEQEEAEIRAEFRADIAVDIDRVESLLARTQAGSNLSDLTLGWFVLGLLSQLSSRDLDLYHRIHPDDVGVETYLRGRFSAHPDEEIAPLLAARPGNGQSLHLAAGYALQALTAIPDPAGSPAEQAECRATLARHLTALRTALARVQAENAPSGPPGAIPNR